jgi:hypothetical protein
MLAFAARVVREIGELSARAKRARRPLAMFAIDTRSASRRPPIEPPSPRSSGGRSGHRGRQCRPADGATGCPARPPADAERRRAEATRLRPPRRLRYPRRARPAPCRRPNGCSRRRGCGPRRARRSPRWWRACVPCRLAVGRAEERDAAAQSRCQGRHGSRRHAQQQAPGSGRAAAPPRGPDDPPRRPRQGQLRVRQRRRLPANHRGGRVGGIAVHGFKMLLQPALEPDLVEQGARGRWRGGTHGYEGHPSGGRRRYPPMPPKIANGLEGCSSATAFSVPSTVTVAPGGASRRTRSASALALSSSAAPTIR